MSTYAYDVSGMGLEWNDTFILGPENWIRDLNFARYGNMEWKGIGVGNSTHSFLLLVLNGPSFLYLWQLRTPFYELRLEDWEDGLMDEKYLGNRLYHLILILL